MRAGVRRAIGLLSQALSLALPAPWQASRVMGGNRPIRRARHGTAGCPSHLVRVDLGAEASPVVPDLSGRGRQGDGACAAERLISK